MDGMPWRTPLLRAFAAGQGQSTTARWVPLLSVAVPFFMPQTCPRRLWVMSHLSTVPLGAHPSRNQPSTGSLGRLPTGGRPALFLIVSASLVSNS
jgi:hypothetical protein